MTGAPDFSRCGEVALRNAKTGDAARLVRADWIPATAALQEQVTRICNEPLVYDLLFRRRFKGAPYPPESGHGFLEGAARGWREGTHYIFYILRGDAPEPEILGNVEVRAPTIETAEIGYWATSGAPGFMTPAVGAVCEIARRAGIGSLFALTRTYNDRSMAVLQRNGFEEVGLVGEGEDLTRKFVRAL